MKSGELFWRSIFNIFFLFFFFFFGHSLHGMQSVIKDQLCSNLGRELNTVLRRQPSKVVIVIVISKVFVIYVFYKKNIFLPEPQFSLNIFFSIWVFFHKHSRFIGHQGKGEAISLTPLCHFHPLHIHLDIRRAITAESSPLHIELAAGIEPGTFGFKTQVADH